MIKVFKYRLYPNKTQAANLEIQFAGHCMIYNQALQMRIDTYKSTGKGIGYCAQSSMLPAFRKQSPLFARCNHSSIQVTLKRLDKAFQAFFRRIKVGGKAGFPRFKNRFDTIAYASLGDGCQIKGERLYLQGIGLVKVKWHRLIGGKIKTLFVTRKSDKWYVGFISECEPSLLPNTGKIIGIDVGLESFLTTSEGDKITPPKFFIKTQKKLKAAQQRISRRTNKRSARRRKAIKLAAKLQEHIANQRRDFHHKVARNLVNNFNLIAVENLNIKNMVKNSHLSKSISDAAWGNFLLILKAKAENAGRWVEEVNARGTSQTCSACGETVKKSLAVRVHKCPFCGLSLCRDQNAARNILARIEPSVLAVCSQRHREAACL